MNISSHLCLLLRHTSFALSPEYQDWYHEQHPNQDIGSKNDLQRRFLADASHELRTPLTIMLSSLELMKKEEGSDPEFQTNALENIYTEAQRMARLTTRLLLLARTDARAPFVRQPLLIVDIISEAYRQGCPSHRKITTQCQGLETLEDAVVSGNADYLKQVFLILLENACKYTPDGGQVTTLASNQGWDLASRLPWALSSSTAGRSRWRARLGREAALRSRSHCSTSRGLPV
jgi:signal transduction histidine kinase